ncbi:Tn3 family transposase [Xanthomonas populi]|uniref:transposase n=1 Tax=Xanthomonas populi TaxID=53414 RepID=UPI001FCA3F39|nr:transposase [Xanthomonas populi]
MPQRWCTACAAVSSSTAWSLCALAPAWARQALSRRCNHLSCWIGGPRRSDTISTRCESEEYNGFVKWVFFGSQGIIAENVQHEQRKIIKYSQLVANMIILHNVEGMSRTLAEMRKEGIELTPEILAGLSPYRTSHINRFGDYHLDLDREVAPLSYTAKVLEQTP